MSYAMLKPRPLPLPTKAIRLLLPLLTCAASTALGQATNNPFPNAITAGITVPVVDFATFPNSNNAKPRLNSTALTPDGRSFVVDENGPVYSLSPTGVPTQYLNIASLGLGYRSGTGEEGVATVAFHPQFTQVGTPGYGKFYTAFSTDTSATTPDSSVSATRHHDEVVYEFTAANPLAGTFTPAGGTSPREVLRLARPASNHNGGQLAFNPNAAPGSPDYGKLYIGTGDSGNGGDPQNAGQTNSVLQGKVLRVDPLGTGGGSTGTKYGVPADNVFAADGNVNTRGEIYATGFRNPQRFSWDKGGTQKMYLGDVGQGVVEEVDVIVNGGNYGWVAREGSFVYLNTSQVRPITASDTGNFINPIAEYDHGEGNAAISGGFVYRGTQIPGLTGKYVFGDLQSGKIFYIDADLTAGGQAAIRELFLTEDGVTPLRLLQIINLTPGVTATRADLRLGQDAAGNLLILNKQDGIARVLVPEPASLALAGLAGVALLRRRAAAR